jgi:DNA-binding GntR family transcriptional regulator
MIHPDVPTYRHMARLLREQIISGALRPGAQVQPEPRLASEHGVGRETARKAIALLRNEGLVEVRLGHGVFVREPYDREVVTLRPGDQVIARMPSPEELRSAGEGVAILVVTSAGGMVNTYEGDCTALRCV